MKNFARVSAASRVGLVLITVSAVTAAFAMVMTATVSFGAEPTSTAQTNYQHVHRKFRHGVTSAHARRASAEKLQTVYVGSPATGYRRVGLEIAPASGVSAGSNVPAHTVTKTDTLTMSSMKSTSTVTASGTTGNAKAVPVGKGGGAAGTVGKTASGSSETWKGPTDGSEVHLGALAGLGMIDFNPGFVLLGTASKKIVHHGFVNEVTDSVSLETEMGPLFTRGTAVFSYSLHLRWDFEMNDRWTIYALGGAGGYIAGSYFSDSFALFPRVGLGAFLRVNDLILIRGEVSHEVIAAGVTIPLYL